MRKPRTNILLLTTIFAVVGLVGQAWLTRKSAPSALSSVIPTVVHPVAATKNAPIGLAEDFLSANETVAPAASLAAIPPEQLSADASVLVAEICDLQLMAGGTNLSLSSNQWMEFAAAVLRFQAIRHTYEAQIAKLSETAPGQYRAEIPMYANVGDELREQFSRELCLALGEQTARDVRVKLGDRLEKRFAGFGISAQTLDITANPAGAPGDIQVTRTMSYWNSVEGSDRLSTRREIHFPVLEDPTGDSWSALLAKAGATGAENGPG